MTKSELTHEYAEKIRPLLDLAKKAYGPKNQGTEAHRSSREYTELLLEYKSKGGSMIALAKELDVAYSGIRRRVFTADLPPISEARQSKKRASAEEIDAAITRVRDAKSAGTHQYHAQLAEEYTNGYSLATIAKGLGITNAAPLYYGVQRHLIRTKAA